MVQIVKNFVRRKRFPARYANEGACMQMSPAHMLPSLLAHAGHTALRQSRRSALPPANQRPRSPLPVPSDWLELADFCWGPLQLGALPKPLPLL